MSNFNDFNLDEKLLQALTELGYNTPTPVQEQAIPKVLEGSDIIASARTGTGKTAAFMLPALHKLITSQKQKNGKPRVLVLAPTRELAMQITAVTEKYTRHLPQIRTVCIYGGVPYPVQTKALSRPHDILVATPGRLLDHMQQRRIDLSSLEFLVLDEADRMLDMGFIEDVETIAEASPDTRQTLLFSATMDKKIHRLSKKLQNNPEEIIVESTQEETTNIEQRLYYVDGMSHKMRLLDHILENTEIKQAIVFISTRNGADSLADHLQERGHITDALHGNMSQRQRTRTIAKLRRGNTDILVATDVAARGIDILTLSHVINIDLPFQAEDYIHRIGRTGRAGGKGVAITFATYREQQALSKINQLLKAPMTPHTIEGLEPQAKSSSNSRPDQNKRTSRGGWNKDKPRAKRSFNQDSPKEFKKEPGRGRDFRFSSDKPRGFGDKPYKRKEFGSSSDQPRSFGDKPFKRKEAGSSSDQPKDFFGGERKKKTFTFSGKPRGFNNDAPGRKKGAGGGFGKKKRAPGDFGKKKGAAPVSTW